MTRQPIARSLRKLRRSRSRFSRSLFRQKSDNLYSHDGSRYPCQKSPSMRTATLAFGKTRSGLAGNDFTCCLETYISSFAKTSLLFLPRATKIFSRVTGRLNILTPQASKIPFVIAGAVGSRPISPTPVAPQGPFFL